MALIFCVIALLAVCSSCRADTSKTALLVNATNCFSTNLSPKLKTSDGNLISSPFSVDIVMTILQVGANGETYDEINKALLYLENGLSKEDVQNQMHSQLQSLRVITDVTLNIENSVWVDEKFPVKSSYKKVVSEKFLATEENLDFQENPHYATETINNWVNDKTNSLIPKLFDEDLDPSTVIVLVNAIYFKGTWVHKFDEQNTHTLPFWNNNNAAESKLVSLMNQQERFSYTDDPELQAQVLVMNYKEGVAKFVAVLPKEGVSLSDVESKLNCIKINEVLKAVKTRQVNVTIPKFDITSSLDLKQPLMDLNIKTVFGDKADLSGIADGELQLSKIVQKARIKVYEEGSEAAAATGGGVSLTSVLEPIEPVEQFNANRPFAFYILHSKSGQILFTGRVTNL